MIKYYDIQNKRLVGMEQVATEEFWKDHWLAPVDFKKRVMSGAENGLIKKYTSLFLKAPAKVVDAGCGIGQNVYGLDKWGYDAYGIDYVTDVVNLTKTHFPHLKVVAEDVRKIGFPDGFFDGYWSLGVIEHFKEGYTDILREASRVLKKDGYLFITVPWFSPLRKLKAKMGLFGRFDEHTDMSHFYEFMLDDKVLTEDVKKHGFSLVSRHPYDAVKGLKDEVSVLKPFLQKIYDSKHVYAKGIRFIFTTLLASFSGHIILLIFKKHE